jgi:hypothetical protein
MTLSMVSMLSLLKELIKSLTPRARPGRHVTGAFSSARPVHVEGINSIAGQVAGTLLLGGVSLIALLLF